MKILLVNPSSLMYSRIYLKLEPVGLELVAESLIREGHIVRILDLQIFSHEDYFKELREMRPEAIGFSLNYLASIPEVLELSKMTRDLFPNSFIFAGGHSASFVAESIISHAKGSIDCIVRGDGEEIIKEVMKHAFDDISLSSLPGVVTERGSGPEPVLVNDLDTVFPAHRLMRKRKKYFIGTLDPCASIEFARGCPWDCSFCSAWTFYGRSYRIRNPKAIVSEMAQIIEPNVFIVDDVAFIYPDHAMEIGERIQSGGIKKQYYLETRADILLKNKDVFRFWTNLGLRYMFLGIEAIDEQSLKAMRKRTSIDKNIEALEFARSLGIAVAINIIADPSWERSHFLVIRQWAQSVPEIVNLTVNTPYPGTETWYKDFGKLTSRDYRLFDVQHAVLPTKLPLEEFYKELIETQQVLYKKHMGFAALWKTFSIASSLVLNGQTNFIRMLWKFNSVYNINNQLSDHSKEVKYEINIPNGIPENTKNLFVHQIKSSPLAQQAF